MKKAIRAVWLSAICCAAAGECQAAGVAVSDMPAWTFADTETSTNCALRIARNPVEDLSLVLEFAGGESNNVEVAFGFDANTNGVLDVSERGLSVGWDCGEWVFRSLGRESLVCPAATTNAQKRLCFSMHVSGYTAKCIAASENDVPIDWGVGSAPPQWAFDPGWNMLRLAVRGVECPFDSLRAAVSVDAIKIRIR